MSDSSPDSVVRRLGDWSLIALFCIALVLPTADLLLNLDRSSAVNENRAPAILPEWNGIGGLRMFLSQTETWFDDHFGFRNRLVRFRNRWRARLFGAPSSADVLVGRNGWLYFAGGRMIDHHLGTRLLAEDELRAWQRLLESRRDWLARRGIGYVFVVAPNKETIHPEHLPEWMTPTGHGTKLDQFMTFMRANSTVEVLDLRRVLREAKPTALTYFPTDSHWNGFGAFVACQALVERIGEQVRGGLVALPIDAFELEFVERTAGDLARMNGGAPVARERDTPVLTPRPPLRPLEARRATSYSAASDLPGREPVFTERPEQRHRVVVFRDSFGAAWYAFLGQHFARALYVFQYWWDPELIVLEQPDVVVDQIAERHLNEGDPTELLTRDGLPP